MTEHSATTEGETPTMRGEYCEAKDERGATCIFGRSHAVRYHLRPDGGAFGVDAANEVAALLPAVFARLVAAVTDAYVAPADDMSPRDRWGRLSLAHQNAETLLFSMGIPVPDAALRAGGSA